MYFLCKNTCFCCYSLFLQYLLGIKWFFFSFTWILFLFSFLFFWARSVFFTVHRYLSHFSSGWLLNFRCPPQRKNAFWRHLHTCMFTFILCVLYSDHQYCLVYTILCRHHCLKIILYCLTINNWACKNMRKVLFLVIFLHLWINVEGSYRWNLFFSFY